MPLHINIAQIDGNAAFLTLQKNRSQKGPAAADVEKCCTLIGRIMNVQIEQK
jgi:hypothetical protein